MAVEINPSDFYDFLMTEVGKPYHYADEGPNSFDCSGLVQFVYGHFGVHTPRTAHEQQAWTTATTMPMFGDLVFYGKPAHHVGIYVDKGMMVDAPNEGELVRQEGVGTPTNYGRVPGVKIMGGVVTDPTTKTIHPVLQWTESLISFFAALMNPNTWLRIGEVTLGLILIAVGTAKLTNAVPVANKIAKVVR